jgi:FkbM family methyltransferase
MPALHLGNRRMLNHFKHIVKTTVNRFINPLGVAIVKKTGNIKSPHEYLHEICQKNNIDLILDVGANRGMTGKAFREAGYCKRIVSFEPQSHVFSLLQEAVSNDSLWECRRIALGNLDGTIKMQLSAQSESSSVLLMGQKHIDVWPGSRPAGFENVPIARLDSLAEELGLKRHRSLLKIDVQGYEASVLQGATAVLPHVFAAYVELLFTSLYDNQTRYYDVMRILEEAGFRFAGLLEPYYEPNCESLLFANGLFVRDFSRSCISVGDYDANG